MWIYILGVLLGAMFGACVGLLIAACCVAARRGDQQAAMMRAARERAMSAAAAELERVRRECALWKRIADGRTADLTRALRELEQRQPVNGSLTLPTRDREVL